MSAARLLVLVLLLPCAGCGVWTRTPMPPPPAWPVRLAGDERGDARPSALVRRQVRDRFGKPLEGVRTLREEMAGLPEESGLFRQVTHQPGLEGTTVEADYTLDFALEREVRTAWYSFLGLIPGIPLVGHDDFTLTCDVRDHALERLGRVTVRRSKTLVISAVCLPFNLLLSLLPGDLGFDVIAMAEDQRTMIRGMIQEALYHADQRFHFAAPAEATLSGGHHD